MGISLGLAQHASIAVTITRQQPPRTPHSKTELVTATERVIRSAGLGRGTAAAGIHIQMIAELPRDVLRQKSPLGAKPSDLSRRRKEAAQISELMATTPGFSFVRLGDGDLILLLAWQERRSGTLDGEGSPVGGALAPQNRAISLRHAERLYRAAERASYVDFHERLWPIPQLLPRLRLARRPDHRRNPDAETSYILLTWLEFEFKEYCRGRTVGLVGAEASLLRELLKEPAFREASSEFWPTNERIHLFQPRGDGKYLDENLDAVGDDLRQWIRLNALDTVFVSLGGAAKILCVELAEELGVRMFDAGAMIRALTYSGSPGNRSCRATHFPFLYRVPFETWVTAMERAFPDLLDHELLAKVHAQLILEVQEKEVGWTHASWELDLSPSNVQAFEQAHATYLSRYRHLFRKTSSTRRERADFRRFCRSHGLTREGRLFRKLRKARSALGAIRRRISGLMTRAAAG